MVAYEITLTDSIRIKYGNHDSKHPKGSLRVAKEGNSVEFSDMNRQRPNSILSVNFDDSDTLTVDGVSIADAASTLEALGTDFFSRAASGGAPDPQVAVNTAAIAQNELIAKMDTLQAGEIIAEAGEIHAYGGRQWISLVDNAEVPDPVSITALEASADFEEFTITPAEIELSTEPGQIATLDSQGRILVRESGVASFKNVVPEVANIPGNATGVFSTTFTPLTSGDYVFEYSGDVQQGGGGMSVGTTVGGTELFVSNPASGDADGSRLTLTRQDNFTPPIP